MWFVSTRVKSESRTVVHTGCVLTSAYAMSQQLGQFLNHTMSVGGVGKLHSGASMSYELHSAWAENLIKSVD